MSTRSTTTTPARSALQRDRAEAVLSFWFGSIENPQKNFDLWFGGTPEIDADITRRFLDDVNRAESGEYDSWLSEPNSAVALIILLDQFPMNIYRDQPKGFVLSAAAIPRVYTTIGRGFLDKVHENMRMFVYMPLMHSEHAEDQRRCVELMGESDEYAVEHRQIVTKYGRFPGRNAVLGRESTEEEKEYLRQGGVF